MATDNLRIETTTNAGLLAKKKKWTISSNLTNNQFMRIMGVRQRQHHGYVFSKIQTAGKSLLQATQFLQQQ